MPRRPSRPGPVPEGGDFPWAWPPWCSHPGYSPLAGSARCPGDPARNASRVCPPSDSAIAASAALVGTGQARIPALVVDRRAIASSSFGKQRGREVLLIPAGPQPFVHVKRTLEIGSYQTVWAMLHRTRSVLVRPGRERLAGVVEVDETHIGGREPGLSGGRAKGKKILTGISVEIREPKRYGRCRIAPPSDALSASLHAFVSDHVEPGATVITNGRQGYRGLDKLGYCHEACSPSAGRGSRQTTACGASGRLIGQAMAAGHSSRIDR